MVPLALGLDATEFYGQTECNYVVSSSAALGISRAGAMGKPVPGHDVAVIGPSGEVLASGEQGQIAVRAPDPVMFLEYWGRPEATKEAPRGLAADGRPGDRGRGRLHPLHRPRRRRDHLGRLSDRPDGDRGLPHRPSGGRLAAVVGKPDPIRTEIVKAYVVLNEGYAPAPALADDIRSFVRLRLSAHEYPREVAFVEAMPLTTTGKVIRRHFRDAARREAGLDVAPAGAGSDE